MDQTARELTMEDWGFLTAHGCTHLILDRDTKFSASFRRTLKDAGIKVLCLPPRSPNLNAFAERFVRSARDDCLSHLILIGEQSLRRALDQFLAHYHEERNHQGVGNVLLFPNALSPEAPSLSTTATFASATSAPVSSSAPSLGCDDAVPVPALAEVDAPLGSPDPTLAKDDAPPPPASGGEVLCKERLGGLLRYYYRKAG
jgi:hypothetical protein